MEISRKRKWRYWRSCWTFYAEKIGLKPKSSTLYGETVLILFSHLLTVNVSNEGYYRNRSCALRYLRFYYSSCITYFVYLVQLNYLWTNFSCCLWRGGGSCLVYVSCVCLRIVVSNIYYVVFFLFFLSMSCVPYVSFCLSFSFCLHSLGIQYSYLSLT